jgi:hypothetical protein
MDVVRSDVVMDVAANRLQWNRSALHLLTAGVHPGLMEIGYHSLMKTAWGFKIKTPAG